MAERRHETPEELPETAGKFVAFANGLGEKVSPDRVRAVRIFATACDSAFSWASGVEPPGQPSDQAGAYLRKEYGTMFRESARGIEPAYRGAQRQKPQ